jgi:hypothetical protein
MPDTKVSTKILDSEKKAVIIGLIIGKPADPNFEGPNDLTINKTRFPPGKTGFFVFTCERRI